MNQVSDSANPLPTIAFGSIEWRTVLRWEYVVLKAGNAPGIPDNAARANLEVRSGADRWNVILSFLADNGSPAGSLSASYSNEGTFLNWQSVSGSPPAGASLSASRVNGSNAIEVHALCPDGGERRSTEPATPDLVEPFPLCLMRAVFAAFQGGEQGEFICLGVTCPGDAGNWVSQDLVSWSLNEDSVEVPGGSVKVWRVDGRISSESTSFAIFIAKDSRGLLRLDMNSPAAALMLARAGA